MNIRFILMILLCAIFLQTRAQCFIQGKETLQTNETSTYTLTNNTAQCEECHQWTVIDKNATIEGNNRLKDVKIKGISGGKATIALSGISEKGPFQCSKTIDIVTPIAQILNPNPSDNTNCDIKTSVFTEKKQGSKIIFIPDAIAEKNIYSWTLTSGDGSQTTLYGKTPELDIEQQTPAITQIQLKIQSGSCLKTITKSYIPGFWMGLQ